MQPYAALRERLAGGGTVVLDAGIGAELVRRGVRWRGLGMRTDSDTVCTVQQEFLAAGADVLRTNTFQLSRRTYLNVFRNADHLRHIGAPGLENRSAELTRRAVELAHQAREQADRPEVAIAGVMSPLQHCFRPDLAPEPDVARPEHVEIAELLADGGVDLLLLESMNTLGEARVAAEAARATGLPIWVSFVVGADGNLLDGEPLGAAAAAMRDLGAEAILVNCAPPEDIAHAVELLATHTTLPFGAYAHIGKFDPPSWKFEFHPQWTDTDTWPPDRYAAAARSWRAVGARLLGGCCGTRPDHIRALNSMLAEQP